MAKKLITISRSKICFSVPMVSGIFFQEQEEMARKVAEMILKDVNSVTEAISAIKNPDGKSTSS